MQKLITLTLCIAMLAITGCTTHTSEKLVIAERDAHGNTLVKLPYHPRVSRRVEKELETQILRKLEGKSGTVRIELQLGELIEVSDILIHQGRNPNSEHAMRVINAFKQNHLASTWQYASSFNYMPPVRGRVLHRDERPTEDAYQLTIATNNLTASVAHPIGQRLFVRISKKKMSKSAWEQLVREIKVGRDKITVEGYLFKEGNNIVLEAQGKFVLRKRNHRDSRFVIPLSLELDVKIVPVDASSDDPNGNVKVGPIEVVD